MQNVPLEILRVKSVLAATGLSRTTLWRRIRSGDFPRPLRLGGAKITLRRMARGGNRRMAGKP